jgi:hypothetical protein
MMGMAAAGKPNTSAATAAIEASTGILFFTSSPKGGLSRGRVQSSKRRANWIQAPGRAVGMALFFIVKTTYYTVIMLLE